jgi:signal transduction histidine kinase
LFLSTNILSQGDSQSIKTIIKNANEELGKYNLKSAGKLIHQAKQASKKLHDQELYYDAFYIEAMLAQNEGNYLQSINILNECYQYFEKNNAKKKYADCLGAIGISYSKMGSYALSFENLYKSLSIYQSMNDSVSAARSMSNIAIVYWTQNKLQKALDYLEKSNSIRVKLKDKKGLALNLGNAAIIYSSMKKNEEAIGKFYETIQECEDLNDRECLAISYSNLGMLIEEKGLLDSALQLQLQGLEYRKVVGDLNGLAVSHNNIASVYYHKKDFKNAIQNATKGLELAEKTHSFEDVSEAAKMLSEIFEKTGNLKSALSYFKIYANAQDSLNSQISEAKFLQAQTNYENRQKQDAAELSKRQTEKDAISNKAQRNILLILLITSLFVIFIFYRFYKDNIETNLILKNKNLELDALNKERDALTKIVAHDLKVPIGQVKGLANLLQISGPLNHDQMQIVDKLNGTVINGYKLIENLLDVSLLEINDGPIDKQPCDLSKIIDTCVKMHNPSAVVKGITLETNVTFFDKINSNEKSITSIIENIISNAIKFSYSNSLVKIDCYDEPDYVYVEIKDSGQGFSETDKLEVFNKYQKLSATPTGGESSTGLGLYLVKLLADNIGVEITLKSKVNLGATFKLKFSKR